LDKRLKPTEEQYLNCIRCGLCLAVCPTYREYKIETSSPRGRVALARKGIEGELDLSRNLFEQMYACFDCMACNDICPVGIRPADLVLDMRVVQEQRKPAFWKKNLFEDLLPRPGRMEVATWPLRLYERSGLRRLVYKLGQHRLRPVQVRDLEAMLPHLPQRPLRQVLPVETPAVGKAKRRVGFFLGCAQSLIFAEESAASVRVLARNGCTVITPKETVCCGMPARGYGREDLVLKQARTNIALFEKADVEVILTDCATCGSTLKEYGTILADDPAWAARAAAFSAKVRDISEYLVSIPLKKPKGSFKARITYHDPCHLRRAQGVWAQPRELLKNIPGVDLVELPEADWCCGSAGSQLITHYETSIKVMDRKIENLKSTAAEIITSGCPGCQMQLHTGVTRHKLKVRVMHPIQILDQAYRNGEEER